MSDHRWLTVGCRIPHMIDPTVYDIQSWQAAQQSLKVAEETLWITFAMGVASLIIAIISVWISRASLRAAETAGRLADETLRQAQESAEREIADWRQTKWFDLYFQASQVYDALDHFQTKHFEQSSLSAFWAAQTMSEYNDFNFLNRKMIAMAVVFPKNDAVDKLVTAAAAFKDREQSLSRERLKLIADAVQDIRELALLRPAVLLPPEMVDQIRKQMTGTFDAPQAGQNK
jgi:hypothetical protein